MSWLIDWWNSLSPATQHAIVGTVTGLVATVLRHYHVIPPAWIDAVLAKLNLPLGPTAAANQASPAPPTNNTTGS